MERKARAPGLGRRLLWFVALYLAGVAATGLVALAIKLALPPPIR